MGIYDEEWNLDSKEILSEVGKDCTVKKARTGETQAFKVMLTEPMVMQDLDTGGFLDSTSFTVKFNRQDCVAHPDFVKFGNVITYNAQEYRIVHVTDRPPSAWIMARVQTLVQ